MNATASKFVQSLCAVALCGAAGLAQANSFECVSGSAGAGANALGCTTQGTALVQWTVVGNILLIGNNGIAGNASAITGISFLAAAGQSVSLPAYEMPGVVYTSGGGAHLPASLGWGPTVDFQPNKQPMANGVNAGEMIAFDLNGVSAADIQSGNFKFGLHIQGLPDGRSEKLISAVPEAESLALAMAGLLTLGMLLKQRKPRG